VQHRVRWLVPVLLVGLAVGCGAARRAGSGPPTLVIVPGCPSQADGRLSGCQWRRVLWASLLWEAGRAEHFVTSGSAVHNRYGEAEALRAGLVAMGVPPDRVFTETQALHTDENIGYALQVGLALGFESFAVASDRNQALAGCSMLRRWGHPCRTLGLDSAAVAALGSQGLPDVRTRPVPADTWLTLEEREERLAEATGRRRRPRSVPYYVAWSILGVFGLGRPPEPPMVEPTLSTGRP